jgi:hypothetical protein
MATVRHTLTHPNTGDPAGGVIVTVRLVTSGYVTGSKVGIIGSSYAVSNADTGYYELDNLTANSAISPAGTYYVVTHQMKPAEVHLIQVPSGAGPFDLTDIEVTDAIPPGVVAATMDALNEAIASLAGTYLPQSQKGAASGVASLGSDGIVPGAQLPASAQPVSYASQTLTGPQQAQARANIGGDATYALTPQGFSAAPLRSRPKQTNQRSLADLRAIAWQRLIEGTLQTRKAAWLAKAQFTSINSNSQSIPLYGALTGGLGDNTAITADQGFFTSVSAVYNLTDDPTRTTNIYSKFFRDIHLVNVTSVIAAGKTLEVQGMLHPYQGLLAAQPAASSTFFEVVEWDGRCAVTTNGIGGGTSADPTNGVLIHAHSPLIPKLPLPNYQSADDSFYQKEAIRPADNFAAAGTEPRTIATAMDLWERLNLTGHDTSSPTNLTRFDRGARLAMFGTSARGAGGTNPQTSAFLPPFNPAPTRALSVIHALVRVADSLYADSVNYPVGRLFLLVATRVVVATTGVAGTLTGGTSAVDLFHPGGNRIDHYDGKVTL